MDSDWKPRLWAVPLPRHYIIARQACLRRQICMLLLQTKAQGASSASDEFSATHTHTTALRTAAPALLLSSGKTVTEETLKGEDLPSFFGGEK